MNESVIIYVYSTSLKIHCQCVDHRTEVWRLRVLQICQV